MIVKIEPCQILNIANLYANFCHQYLALFAIRSLCIAQGMAVLVFVIFTKVETKWLSVLHYT